MLIKVLINLLIWLAIMISQLAFLPNLPLGWNYLNLLLVTLVFVLLLLPWPWAVAWWLASAWLLDIFSFQSFGLYLIVLALTCLTVYWLLINFFTNYSLYACLVLTATATLLYDFGYLVWPILWSNWLGQSGQSLNNGFWFLEAQRLFANLLLTIIFFYILNFLSHRFRPVFLQKK